MEKKWQVYKGIKIVFYKDDQQLGEIINGQKCIDCSNELIIKERVVMVVDCKEIQEYFQNGNKIELILIQQKIIPIKISLEITHSKSKAINALQFMQKKCIDQMPLTSFFNDGQGGFFLFGKKLVNQEYNFMADYDINMSFDVEQIKHSRSPSENLVMKILNYKEVYLGSSSMVLQGILFDDLPFTTLVLYTYCQEFKNITIKIVYKINNDTNFNFEFCLLNQKEIIYPRKQVETLEDWKGEILFFEAIPKNSKLLIRILLCKENLQDDQYKYDIIDSKQSDNSQGESNFFRIIIGQISHFNNKLEENDFLENQKEFLDVQINMLKYQSLIHNVYLLQENTLLSSLNFTINRIKQKSRENLRFIFVLENGQVIEKLIN